ncbi:MAG: exoP [Rhodospirillaceae bacterium]|nr:MAG: exoP [Rhodospirillaceae bacterium]
MVRRFFPAGDGRRVHNAVIDRFLDRLDVTPVPRSYVFGIKVTSTDAQKAARIINTVADLYIVDQLEAKFKITRRTTD